MYIIAWTLTSSQIFSFDCSTNSTNRKASLLQAKHPPKKFKKVFINAQILEESGEEWKFNEGCLSIPDVREDVKRKGTIVIEYYDENFVKHTETFSDIRARVIQHEYDHIEGVLFTDHLSALKKKLVKGKLTKISQGEVNIGYKMRFPK